MKDILVNLRKICISLFWGVTFVFGSGVTTAFEAQPSTKPSYWIGNRGASTPPVMSTCRHDDEKIIVSDVQKIDSPERLLERYKSPEHGESLSSGEVHDALYEAAISAKDMGDFERVRKLFLLQKKFSKESDSEPLSGLFFDNNAISIFDVRDALYLAAGKAKESGNYDQVLKLLNRQAELLQEFHVSPADAYCSNNIISIRDVHSALHRELVQVWESGDYSRMLNLWWEQQEYLDTYGYVSLATSPLLFCELSDLVSRRLRQERNSSQIVGLYEAWARMEAKFLDMLKLWDEVWATFEFRVFAVNYMGVYDDWDRFKSRFDGAVDIYEAWVEFKGLYKDKYKSWVGCKSQLETIDAEWVRYKSQARLINESGYRFQNRHTIMFYLKKVLSDFKGKYEQAKDDLGLAEVDKA